MGPKIFWGTHTHKHTHNLDTQTSFFRPITEYVNENCLRRILKKLISGRFQGFLWRGSKELQPFNQYIARKRTFLLSLEDRYPFLNYTYNEMSFSISKIYLKMSYFCKIRFSKKGEAVGLGRCINEKLLDWIRLLSLRKLRRSFIIIIIINNHR